MPRKKTRNDGYSGEGEITQTRFQPSKSGLVPPKETHQLEAEIQRLKAWINDCQAGMYINCVYCGHRYGPDTEIPATMADVLKEHIQVCPEHPMSLLVQKLQKFRFKLDEGLDVDEDLKELLKGLPT